MAELAREPADGRAAPGSTFRPITRFAARSAGVEIATATLGLAEVFERHPLEYLVGRLSWTDAGAVRDVVAAAVAEVPAGAPVHLLTWQDGLTAGRREIALDCGFELFQEKLGFWWPAADTPTARSRTATMTEVGREPVESVLRRCAGATLDRTDRAMIARDGIDRWVRDFLDTHATDTDRRTWLLAADATGAPVGYVGLCAREGNSGTIVHIGVIPDRRGNSHGRDLVAAARAAARAAGWTGLRALVDAVNQPMLTTLRHTGFAPTSWHKWHYALNPSGGPATPTNP
jgi:GNAT superfamily N-acetyltransferase